MSRWKLEDSARFMHPVSVVVDIDDTVFTEEAAREINAFWTSPDERLAIADGDVRRAALMMIACELIWQAIRHDGSTYLVQREFNDAEGFPPGLLKVVSCEELDEIAYEDIAITEMEAAS